MILSLGIETSCDETAAAVVDESGLVLSDVVHSQIELHAPYGGVIPELASRDHLRNAPHVVTEALKRAGIPARDLDVVCVTHRPGLVGALLVGVQLAKGFAFGLQKPLVGVDHLVGHIVSPFLRRDTHAPPGPAFPYVALLVSGGHTALYRVEGPSPTQMKELGATRDDAAGEAYDKVAKLFGLGYPGGPLIDRLAQRGKVAPGLFKAPMRAGLEFSFSGIKTQAMQLVQKHGVPEGEELANVCASFQHCVVSLLVEKTLRAAEAEGIQTVVIGGGVAANRQLRETLAQRATSHGVTCFFPDLASTTDNAAMIAYAGLKDFATRGEEAFSGAMSLVATSRTALEKRTRKGRGER